MTEEIDEQEQTQPFQKLATLNFYSPVSVDGVKFGVGIYESNGIELVSADDFFKALGIPKINIDNTIYHWLNKLELEQGKDYDIKPSLDSVINSRPEHIFTLPTAYRIALEMNTISAKAAVDFFANVLNYETIDVAEIILFDIVIRGALYPLKTIANIMEAKGYNDQDFGEEKLTKMLVKDRVLTRALRPTKEHITHFVYFDNQISATLHGLQYILRKYAGFTKTNVFATIAGTLGETNRLKSDDLFETERVCENIEENITKEKND